MAASEATNPGVLRPYRRCSGVGCHRAAGALRCPTCLKLGLPDSFFCDQTCFKESWAIHKLLHTVPPPSSYDSSLPSHFIGFKFSGPLRPMHISPTRVVPDSIKKPNYAVTGDPFDERAADRRPIPEYTPAQIEGMRTVCRLAREVMDIAGMAVRPGITTDEIDAIVHEECLKRKSYPSPLNYRGFPKSCCTSINEVICHGIPDKRPLVEGDIVNIDITLYHNGYHGDINEMFFVGEVDEEGKRLVKCAYECMMQSIEECARPGKMYKNIGTVISRRADKDGFAVVREYCGHGIGMLFHTQPNVPHYAGNKAVGTIKANHIFTVEPMINIGKHPGLLWPDQWTSATRDGKRSAQFEHTILITPTGYELLTGRDPNKVYSHPFYVPEAEVKD